MTSAETIRVLTPELIVVLAATFIYVAGAFLPTRKLWAVVGVASLVTAALVLVGQYNRLFWHEGAHEPLLTAAVGGPLAVDLLGIYIRLLALTVGIVFVLLVARPQNMSLAPEVVGTVLMAVAGLMLAGGSRDLVLLFLGLELISIPTYILLFLGRRDGASAESAAKYFFLSILSSGITLYGFSFLYGIGGSTNLADIQLGLEKAKLLSSTGGVPLYAQLGLVLITAGLGFKIAAVPFHFYAPDVYQGTTHANAGILAVLPKIAGIAALVRIVSVAMPGTEETAVRVLMILALVTMTLGNVTALWQNDVRRMMAYSSIAHAGYMLVGLAVDFASRTGQVPGTDGIGATLFYVAAYSLATAGLFAVLSALGSPDRSVDSVDDLAGIAKTRPFLALCAAVFLFSLAGLPPLPGFWGKFAIFSGAVKVGLAGEAASKLSGWFIFVAIVGMLNAAISAGYYLRLIGAMFFRTSEREIVAGKCPCSRMAVIVCLLLTFWITFRPGELLTASDGASRAARVVPAAPAPTQTASR